MAKVIDDNKIYATGKRKAAVARVWITPGSGQIVVNRDDVSDYFSLETNVQKLKQPLELTERIESYDVFVNVAGGGTTGQAGAIRHGIARALATAEPDLRTPLKRAGMLMRDARKVERKKYGQRGARRRFQFSKR